MTVGSVGSIVTQRPRSAPGSGATAGFRRMERLGGLDGERLFMSLAFLAGFRPEVFDAVLDATEPCPGDEPDPAREPEPFRVSCGENAGIFWPLGDEWRHFRPGAGLGGKPEVYDAGHEPAIGWRTPRN